MLQHILSASNKKKAVIGAAAVCIVAAGWHIYSSITAQPVSEKTIPLVRTITVGESDTSLANVYPGEVHGRYESNLAFQVTGKINSRPVNIGDTVQSGQILMTIDPKDVLQSVESSNAQLRQQPIRSWQQITQPAIVSCMPAVLSARPYWISTTPS